MKYANLLYSDFCRNAGKKLQLDPINMGYGDPASDKSIPPILLNQLRQELTVKNAGAYSENQGELSLIRKVQEYIKKDENLLYEYEIAILTAGGRSALTNILASISSANDVVLIPYPAWSGYKSIAKFLNIIIYPIKTSLDNNFIPTLHQIEESIDKARLEYPQANIKAMIINTPHNPTGTVYPVEAIKDILNTLHTYEIICIADYTYRAIRSTTTLVPSINKVAEEMESSMKLEKHTFTNNIVSMQTFGKVTLTPGLRLGYVSTTNKKLIDIFCEKKQATDFGGNVFMQRAFANYLNTKEQIEEFQSTNMFFEKRRLAFIDGLKTYGYMPKNKNIIVSGGVGFYISFKIPRQYKALNLNDFIHVLEQYDFIKDSIEVDEYLSSFKIRGYVPASEVFVLNLIKTSAVNVLPGHLFCSKDKEEYENWVRVALINEEITIKEAFQRIKNKVLEW